MRKQCPICKKGINLDSCVSRVTINGKVAHFSCWLAKERKVK